MRKHILPILTLFLLSPIIGEMVSGSAPPASWLQPATYLVMVPLYGAGAVLARELFIRWRSGWIGAILLGAAYGILEEGIDVMSFFNTAWPDLGAAATYGRWADVSWEWAVLLTCYHAAFSIATPILLTHLIFPKVRGESWLGGTGLILFGVLLGATALFGNLLFRSHFHYSPPLLPYLGSIAVIAALVWAARKIRPSAPVPKMEKKPLPAAVIYALAGFGSTVAFFYVGWGLPETDCPAILAILVLLALSTEVVVLLAFSYRRGRQFTDGRKLALVSGGMMFFVLISPFMESAGINPATGENPSGMICVGTLTFFALVLLSIIVWRRESRESRLSDTFPRD
jgi:hypothetical protein